MKYQIGPFFKGLIIVMGVFLFIMGLINYLIDPYWYREKRITHLNSIPLAVVERTAPVMNVFRLHSKGPNVKFSILGTSHVLAGISDCNYPSLEKIAVSSMSIKESSDLVREILERASVQKTIFIEVCGINPMHIIRDDNFCNRIFSLRTLFYSIKTVKTNLANSQSIINPLCIPDVPKVDSLKSIDAVNTKLAPLRIMTDEEITSLKEMYKVNHKAKHHLQHQIIFFIPPLPTETMEQEKYKLINHKLSLQLQEIISSLQYTNSDIKFKFINLLNTEIGEGYQFRKNNFYDGWYDSAHFKPIVGDQVVNYLTNHSQ